MLTNKHALVILNPHAGRGRARKLEDRLRSAIRAHNWDADIRLTQHAGHEVALAASAREQQWPVVIAVGGDGTAHGVANGLLADGPTETILGHVPVGTGNDFAKTIGLKPGPLERNLARVLGGQVKSLDVGRALGEYFINGLGVGFGAEVVRQTLKLERLRGFPLYLAAVYRTFASFTAPWLEVTSVEHSESGRLMMLEVSIGTTAGGGFRLTPDARPDDGLFDACIIRELGWIRFLRYIPRVMRGTHTGLPPVTIFQTPRVRVTGTSGPMALHLDGELRFAGEPTVEAEILPQGLRALCVA